MCRSQKDPLRPFSQEERKLLELYRRSLTMPADQVIHAKEVLAVADGHTFTDAAKLAGRKSGDAVAHLISRFKREGLPAASNPPRGVARLSVTHPSRVSVSSENFAALLIGGSMGPPPGHWSRYNVLSVGLPMVFPV
jgi:hypothetical protein